MRIGVFDSGLGGLFIAQAIIEALPEYDYVYLGDTKRVPYGNRSQEAVYQFTCEAVQYLFEKQDCQLVILACNTASSEALRKLQQEWLPVYFPERRVLGVIVPTVEALANYPGIKKVGILATTSTVNSKVYPTEIQHRYPELEVVQQATPLLVPLIEHNGLQWARPIVEEYLQSLRDCQAIILGCTHYAAVKNMIEEIVGVEVKVLVQTELVPSSLMKYLERHPELEVKLSKSRQRQYLVTDLTDNLPHFNLNPNQLTEISL